MRSEHELRLRREGVGELEVDRRAASREVDQRRVGEADVDPAGERRDGGIRALDQAVVADGLDLLEVATSIGFKGISFHALRHTHVSQLHDAGIDIVTISKRLGHRSVDITLRIYSHMFRKDDGKASAAIDAALAGLGGA